MIKLYKYIKLFVRICRILLNINMIGGMIQNRIIISKGEKHYEIVRKIIS